MASKTKKTAFPCVATPFHFQELALDSVGMIEDLLRRRTTRQLDADLKSRGLKIPREKTFKVARLVEHICNSGAVLTATIG